MSKLSPLVDYWGRTMDLHPVENQPILSVAAPAVTQGNPAGGQSGQPLIDTPPRAHIFHSPPGREGRFFQIQRLPSSAWRCTLKLYSGRTASWRDFGYTAEDYLRAWEWGNEWAS